MGMLAAGVAPEEWPATGTSILGLRLANPLIVASSPLTDSSARVLRLLDAGAGAVITKTIFAGPAGRQREKVRAIGTGFLNSTTYSRRPLDQWLATLREFAARRLPIIVSIHADQATELGRLSEAIAETGALALELGIACPNDGSQQRLTPEHVYRCADAVRRACGLPFSVKLTAAESYVDQAYAALGGGAQALSISDALPSIRVDVERGTLMLGGPVGYSGAGILPLVLYSIYLLRRSGIACPIMGVGGVETAQDVLEYLHVGASAVQVYSALLRVDYCLATVAADLADWLREKGTDVRALVGSARDGGL